MTIVTLSFIALVLMAMFIVAFNPTRQFLWGAKLGTWLMMYCPLSHFIGGFCYILIQFANTAGEKLSGVEAKP